MTTNHSKSDLLLLGKKRSVSAGETDPVADPVDRLLRLLESEPLAPSRIQAALGMKHRPTFKENYLRPALVRGFIEMTLPDKPNSRLQRYRLTTAGTARLAATRRGTK